MGYKLVYFNGKGRAEVCRLIFAYAGQEFEDVRVEREQWPAMKADTPFGQLPYLEIDGKTKICQSNAMARLLAKRFGIYGDTDIEAAQIDMIVDCCEDMIKPLLKIFFALKDAEQEEAKKKYIEEEFPGFCEKFEKLLVAGGGKYFLGDKFSWADINVAATLEWPAMMDGLAVDSAKFPKLSALKTAVEAQPKIAEWIAKRPTTEF